MRCCCCDTKLTDFESTRKSAVTGDYLDMCNKCIQGLNISTQDRGDLQSGSERSSIYEDPEYDDLYGVINLDEPILRDDYDEQ